MFATRVGLVLSNDRKKALAKKNLVEGFLRRVHSQYYTIYQNMRENDQEFYYNYLRMLKER